LNVVDCFLLILTQLTNTAETAKEFFALPTETKKQYAYGGKEMHGWMEVEQET